MVASPFYHQLHIVQLRVMHRLTSEEEFARVADRWESYTRSRTQPHPRPLLQDRVQTLLLLIPHHAGVTVKTCL